MYFVQVLDYLDSKDWIEESFEHMTMVLEPLDEFHKSIPDAARDLCFRD
jgi:hypothetical protein